MSELTNLELNYTHFLNKNTIALGASGSGKSFVTVDIMCLLKPHVQQVIVFAPTDPVNHTYDRGLVPLPCIHYTISETILMKIWERQEALMAVSQKANRINILKKLFDRLRISSHIRDVVRAIDDKLVTLAQELQNSDLGAATTASKIKEMKDDCDKWKIIIYKQYINESRAELIQMAPKLSEDERFSLKNMNINPNILLIFDDCTDILEKLSTKPIMKRIFFQGRHTGVSGVFCVHTDKAFAGELRKGAYATIFTEEKSAAAYFDRKTNDYTKDDKLRAIAACRSAFTPALKHQKLIWVRGDNRFYKFTATPREDFSFGSSYIWSFCEKIQSSPGTISSSNKYLSGFINTNF